jgi:hypothetical protein
MRDLEHSAPGEARYWICLVAKLNPGPLED